MTSSQEGVKNIFLCNIILSLFILILGWHLSILNIKSETFIYILISQVVLVSLSFWITVYCKKNSTYNQEKNQIIKVSIKEGIEYGAEVMIERNLNDSYIQNIIKCSILTSIEFVLIIILYIIFPNVIQHSDSRIYVILFSIPIIFGFILLNEYKNRLYYEDKVYKKTTILDTVLIIVGITFLFFFAGVVYYKTGITNFYVLILPIAMLYNILNTNYKISKDYHKIFNERKKQKLRK